MPSNFPIDIATSNYLSVVVMMWLVSNKDVTYSSPHLAVCQINLSNLKVTSTKFASPFWIGCMGVGHDIILLQHFSFLKPYQGFLLDQEYP
jgi:hypothetical protein